MVIVFSFATVTYRTYGGVTRFKFFYTIWKSKQFIWSLTQPAFSGIIIMNLYKFREERSGSQFAYPFSGRITKKMMLIRGHITG